MSEHEEDYHSLVSCSHVLTSDADDLIPEDHYHHHHHHAEERGEEEGEDSGGVEHVDVDRGQRLQLEENARSSISVEGGRDDDRGGADDDDDRGVASGDNEGEGEMEEEEEMEEKEEGEEEGETVEAAATTEKTKESKNAPSPMEATGDMERPRHFPSPSISLSSAGYSEESISDRPLLKESKRRERKNVDYGTSAHRCVSDGEETKDAGFLSHDELMKSDENSSDAVNLRSTRTSNLDESKIAGKTHASAIGRTTKGDRVTWPSYKLPETGTNIDDLMARVDLRATGRRYLLLGLDHECRMFHDCETTWQHIRQSFEARAKHADDSKDKDGNTLFYEPMWIDVQSPGQNDLQLLEKYFHLHPLTTEDCHVNDTGEKWELFEHPTSYLYVSLIGEADDDDYEKEEELVQLHVIVFENYVLTIHDRPIKGLGLVLRRIETEFEISIAEAQRRSKQKESGTHRAKKKMRRGRKHAQGGEKFPVLPESNILAYKYDPFRSHIKHWGIKSTVSQVDLAAEDDFTENNELESMPVRILTNVTQPPNEISDSGAVGVMTPTGSIATEMDNMDVEVGISSSGDTVINVADIEQRRKTEIPSPDWVLYAFLDGMVDIYMPHVDNLVDEVENLDELVMMLSKSERSDLLRRIGFSKRSITKLRRFFVPKNRIIVHLVSKKLGFISNNVQLYFRDVLDHLSMSLEKLEYARENLVQTHSNFMTKTSMEIAASTSRTDAFINRLTVIAMIITPLTLISGIWGMNVKVPGQEVDNLFWFFGILGGMAILSLIMFIMFHRQLIQSSKSK